MTKPTLPTILFRHLWTRLQAGDRKFTISDTSLEFGVTAYTLSKAVRRFNETGHALNFPGMRFHAKVIDAYKLEISAEQILDKRPEELFQ